jgi:hypothetical protein
MEACVGMLDFLRNHNKRIRPEWLVAANQEMSTWNVRQICSVQPWTLTGRIDKLPHLGPSGPCRDLCKWQLLLILRRSVHFPTRSWHAIFDLENKLIIISCYLFLLLLGGTEHTVTWFRFSTRRHARVVSYLRHSSLIALI